MARSKSDPPFEALFDGPDGAGEEANRRDALRRDVLEIIETVGSGGPGAPDAPLDDGLVSAYLDDALDTSERAALQDKLAACHAWREQVAAAALAREAALADGLAMPAEFAGDYDAVPPPSAQAPKATTPVRRPGPIGRLFGAPMPARRWLAAALPVLAVAVITAVIGPEMLREKRENPERGGDAALRAPAAPMPRDKADVPRQRDAERKAEEAKPPAEAALPKLERRRIAPRPPKVSGGAGDTGRSAGAAGAAGATDKDVAVLTTAIVPLSSELRDAVVVLGRSQVSSEFAAPKKQDRQEKEADKRESMKRLAKPAPPAAGSRADERVLRDRRNRPGAAALGGSDVAPRHIDVINKAVSPDCTKDPAACCGSHQVDQNLLSRLLSADPPLQSVKVLHLASRACYLTLP